LNWTEISKDRATSVLGKDLSDFNKLCFQGKSMIHSERFLFCPAARFALFRQKKSGVIA
jgi:hypothetical protein